MYNTYAYTQIKEKYGVWETEIEVMQQYMPTHGKDGQKPPEVAQNEEKFFS